MQPYSALSRFLQKQVSVSLGKQGALPPSTKSPLWVSLGKPVVPADAFPPPLPKLASLLSLLDLGSYVSQDFCANL